LLDLQIDSAHEQATMQQFFLPFQQVSLESALNQCTRELAQHFGGIWWTTTAIFSVLANIQKVENT